MAEEEKKSLELVLAQLDREFGRGSVMRLGNENVEPWPSIPTGALSLDMALGIGGLPRGRMVEISGMESTGKSTVALSVVAEAQRIGLECVYVDIENGLDPGYMRALGLNLDTLLISQPDNAEQALTIVERLVRSGEIGVIVVDSVAALVPTAELEGDMGQSHMGLQARLMSQALRKLNNITAETQTLVIWINQIRMKIGVMFGNPETRPGGLALRFYCSVRIDLRKKEDIKDKDGVVTGLRVKAKVIKNKMAPSLRITEFDIIYGRGVNTLGCIVDLALEKGIITRTGAWISYEGAHIGNGRDKTVLALASDLELADRLKDRILNNGT